jgi:hypothetical protein
LGRALRRQSQRSNKVIGPHDGEAGRERRVVSLFQQRCLQTSCALVQVRLQAPVLDDGAGFACAAVVGMQAF